MPLALAYQLAVAKRRADAPLKSDTPAAREERAYEMRRDRMKYGLLDALYSPSCWWWEAYELLRKLAIVGLVLLAVPGTVLQVWCAAILCLAALIATTFINPFTNGKLNALNFISMCCLLLIVINGLGHHKAYQTSQEVAIEDIEWILPDVLVALLCTPIVAAVMVLYLGYLDAKMAREETLLAYQLLPAPIRDEVPDAVQGAEKRRVTEEFRRRHAHVMGRAIELKEAKEEEARALRAEARASRAEARASKAAVVGVGAEALLSQKLAEADEDGTPPQTPMQPPPIPRGVSFQQQPVEEDNDAIVSPSGGGATTAATTTPEPSDRVPAAAPPAEGTGTGSEGQPIATPDLNA